MELRILDLIGVFAFASYGSFKALERRLDLFGVFVSAALTALGGGAIREIILNSHPIFLHDYTYIMVVALGVLFTVGVYRHFHKINKYMLILDAIGLTTFAFIGANRAAQAGLGLGAMVLFAVLTAAGGGVLSDIIIGRPPQLFYGDFYAVPAMLMALLYHELRPYLGQPLVVTALLSGVLFVRLGALYFQWAMWRPTDRPLNTYMMKSIIQILKPLR